MLADRLNTYREFEQAALERWTSSHSGAAGMTLAEAGQPASAEAH
jgi:hypothetical protein